MTEEEWLTCTDPRPMLEFLQEKASDRKLDGAPDESQDKTDMELAAVFAVEKPGHLDGIATRSFQFFDQTGTAAFKVYLNFGGRISPEGEALFVELRQKFKR